MRDRNRFVKARAGGLAAAVGAGAVIACSAAVPAWAAEDGGGPGSKASTSEASRPQATSGPGRQGDSSSRIESGADDSGEAKSPTSSKSDELSDRKESAEQGLGRPSRSQTSGVRKRDTVDESTDIPSAPTIDDETTPAPGDSQETALASDTLNEPTGTPSAITIDDNEITTVPGDQTPPVAPTLTPVAWTLLGSAHRKTTQDAVPSSTPDTTGEPIDTDSETVVGAVHAVTPLQDPLEGVESLYTGKPSFVHNVVTFGLYVLKAVLKPFGGLLAFTSLKVPFLTDGIPPFFLTAGLDVERSEFEGMKVWTLAPRNNPTDKTVVALHGGAYLATASIFHWWTYADMARDTGATVIVPLQTLVPAGGTAASEVPRTANFITKVIDDRGAENVSVFGDSAGGGLALAALQELARRGSRNPARLVLMAPWLDVSMSDPRSAEIRDPLLDLVNLSRAGAKWAGAAGTTDPQASPLFGSLEGLPPTYVYSSSLDLITVDTLRLRDRVLAEQIPDVTFRLRQGLVHDWFTFPFLPDAHEDRPSVYRDLLGADELSVVHTPGATSL